MTPAELTQALQWRYATKRFDPERRIPDPTWKALEEALVLTPSSYGLQPWKFLVVQDPDLRASLMAASWNQRQVTECSHFVVLLAQRTLVEADLDRFLARTAEVRRVDPHSLEGFKAMLVRTLLGPAFVPKLPHWAENQVYLALGNLLTSAALLGLDACPLEGFSPAQYDTILALEDTPWHSVVACALGYREEGDKYAALPKVRYPLEEVIERR